MKNTGGIIINKFEYILQNVSKPQQYIGCEYGLKRMETDAPENKNAVKVLLSFPDTYEIGMSNFAVKILFEIMESIDGVICDRAFLPEDDCAALMKKIDYPLHSLNYRIPAAEFDAIGVTLEYELNYSNVLHLLDLAGIALESKDRKETDPVVIAGGSACVNPEPMADFIDVFFIGDGEEAAAEICAVLKESKKSGLSRGERIKALSRLRGAYVPAYYEPVYGEPGVQAGIKKIQDGAPERIKVRTIKDLDSAFHPVKLIVPNFETVFNRGVVEIARGCKNACRFCQAGFIYRPYRERSVENIKSIIKKIFLNTGYTEFTLSSLSATDHGGLKEIINYTLGLNEAGEEFRGALFSVSLPSQRISTFSVELAGQLSKNKKSGLTFAPEAGSQRMRDVINKNVSEQDLYTTAEAAVASGYRLIKLYFMIGLPFETDEDLLEMARIISRVAAIAREKKTRGFSMNVTFSTFVPKPHTPFQWARQASREEVVRKQELIREQLKKYREICLKFTRYSVTELESAFARGSRKLCGALLDAYKDGCRFDAWDDRLKLENWRSAFEKNGMKLADYATREIKPGDYLPWSLVDTGIDAGFLEEEFESAEKERATPACDPGRCKRCGIC
ncbi:MAG TPA: TIGR03960 family B12-binding radical SAM protein [Candidatus Wallbacteria bacterium]|nr:MAG: Radical SAM superfamily protein [bacterium ADurb.Bin243]HPG57484.1 TIGR03960 family B12-binding radical SAM protein [Candidatus Wallbacteria bacterium]